MENDCPWGLSKNKWGKWEVNAGDEGLLVNCGANQVIEIDKLYGPLAAFGVKIRLEYKGDVSDWVVERERYNIEKKDTEWVEVARWNCQLEWFPDKD